MRWFLRAAAVAAAVAIPVAPAAALVVAARPPMQRAATAELVVVGKVTAIEKEPVEAIPFSNAQNKVAFQVAVVQVTTPITKSADNLTHIKVGFIPPRPNPNQNPAVRPLPSRPGLAPQLAAGDEYLFYLVKHPDAAFYLMPNMSPPIKADGDAARKDVDAAKRVATVLADPLKGLNAETADDRYFAAAALVARYRTYPDFGSRDVDQVPVPADESRLILKALAERDWAKREPGVPGATEVFFSLGLTPNDGWTQPKAKPGVDYTTQIKSEFTKWRDGPGKDYQVKRVVPRKK